MDPNPSFLLRVLEMFRHTPGGGIAGFVEVFKIRTEDILFQLVNMHLCNC